MSCIIGLLTHSKHICVTKPSFHDSFQSLISLNVLLGQMKWLKAEQELSIVGLRVTILDRQEEPTHRQKPTSIIVKNYISSTCQLGVVKLSLMASKSDTKLINKLHKINELLQTQEKNGWLYAIPTPAGDTRLIESINAVLVHYFMLHKIHRHDIFVSDKEYKYNIQGVESNL